MSLRAYQVLITGASRGLGTYVARSFWREGADLLLVARTQSALEALRTDLLRQGAPEQRAHILPLDLTQPSAIEDVMAQVKTHFGGIDVLINDAGDQGPIGPIWENDWREWEQSLRLNLLVPTALCRACIPLMAARGRGHIINLSGGGATGPRPNFSAYAVAKVGIVRLTETLAQEALRHNIAVNCIAPGAMYSLMQDCILRAGPIRAGDKDYRTAERLKTKAATGDDSVARQAAELCVFLASPEAAGVTGKLISAVWDPWRELGVHRQDLAATDVYTLRRIVPRDRNLSWGRD